MKSYLKYYKIFVYTGSNYLHEYKFSEYKNRSDRKSIYHLHDAPIFDFEI